MRDIVTGWNASEEPESMRWNASSPLVTSIMALFGNDSWIRTITNITSKQADFSNENAAISAWWKPLCERQPLYHTSIASQYCEPDKKPIESVAHWLTTLFNPGEWPAEMEMLIYSGIVLTNKAILLIHRYPEAPRNLDVAHGRIMYSSPGFYIVKPDMSVISMIIISILRTIQIAGLLFCGAYIARVPTWTRAFNAMAIARIGAGLEKDKLPVDGQYAEDEDYERLRVAELPLKIASANAIRRRLK
jgi:hypothetical protein